MTLLNDSDDYDVRRANEDGALGNLAKQALASLFSRQHSIQIWHFTIRYGSVRGISDKAYDFCRNKGEARKYEYRHNDTSSSRRVKARQAQSTGQPTQKLTSTMQRFTVIPRRLLL